MRITDIQFRLCEAGLRNWQFVEIHTDEGITGVGEGTVEGQALTVKARVEEMSRYLLGTDPRDIALHTRNLTRDPFWVCGYVSGSALAALEMAMWDISGKKLGVPVWRLWGGPIRDRVRVYANGWYFSVESPEDWGDRAGEVVELGYTAMKFDPYGKAGPRISREELDRAEAVVREVRRGAGPKTDLLIEAHGRFDLHAYIQAARAVEPFDCFWYEEPIVPGNHAALPQLAESVSIPVATGERVFSRHDARELLELRAVTVLQCDVCHCGGLEEIRKIAAVAETYSVAVAPHNPNGPVATAACLAIDAVIPNFMIQEMITPWDVDWRDDVVTGSPRVVDGLPADPRPTRPGRGARARRTGQTPIRSQRIADIQERGLVERNMTSDEFAGKVAVVAGAGRGIGRAVVRDLARSGADIAMCSRSAGELDALAAEVREMGRKVVAVPTAVAEWDQVEAFASKVHNDLGPVDILSNNAGVSRATWRSVIDINLTGIYHVARAVINDMPRGGKIINTGSGAGENAVANQSSYNASKAGVQMFTGVLVLEVWDRGICVNTLIPGPVATLIADWSMNPASEEAILAEFQGKPAPHGPSEIVKPAGEVAEFVHHIFSLAESGPTGQIFSIARRPF